MSLAPTSGRFTASGVDDDRFLVASTYVAIIHNMLMKGSNTKHHVSFEMKLFSVNEDYELWNEMTRSFRTSKTDSAQMFRRIWTELRKEEQRAFFREWLFCDKDLEAAHRSLTSEPVEID